MVQELEKLKETPRVSEEEIQKMNSSADQALGKMPWTRKRRIRQINESIRSQVKESSENTGSYSNTDLPGPSENINREEQYAAELAINQEHYQAEQQLIDSYNEGIQYGHPSYIKYGIASLLGLITESTDFLDLIGIGVVVSKPVALFLTFIIFLIFWLTNTRQKRADQYTKESKETIEAIVANLALIEKRAVQTAKIARRLGATRFAARIRISSRLVKKNPLFKFAAAGAANLVPFLAVFPWVLLGIYLTYRDEKGSYQNARETAGEIAEQIPEIQNV